MAPLRFVSDLELWRLYLALVAAYADYAAAADHAGDHAADRAYSKRRLRAAALIRLLEASADD